MKIEEMAISYGCLFYAKVYAKEKTEETERVEKEEEITAVEPPESSSGEWAINKYPEKNPWLGEYVDFPA